jgi:hypothetical protein
MRFELLLLPYSRGGKFMTAKLESFQVDFFAAREEGGKDPTERSAGYSRTLTLLLSAAHSTKSPSSSFRSGGNMLRGLVRG